MSFVVAVPTPSVTEIANGSLIAMALDAEMVTISRPHWQVLVLAMTLALIAGALSGGG